ncbi:MAG TPA: hypothetical protein VFW17_05640 [Ktedonobacterales bacterium]|nr:hypothetical protein [Ktedonobacterales bacterium]
MENTPQLAMPTPTPEDPIEALTGSAFQRLGTALVAVAKRPSRAAYATWMRVVEPGWIVPLLGVTLVIGMLNGMMSAVEETFLRAPASHRVYYRFGAPSFADHMIYSLFISPLFGVIEFALLMLFIAALMPAERGSLKERAIQVARPYLLAEIVTGLIFLLIFQPITVLGRTPVGENPLVGLVSSLVTLPILVYIIVAELNALAAGSGKNRWLLFGVWLLGGSIVAFIVPYGMGVLLYPFGIHVAVPF